MRCSLQFLHLTNQKIMNELFSFHVSDTGACCSIDIHLFSMSCFTHEDRELYWNYINKNQRLSIHIPLPLYLMISRSNIDMLNSLTDTPNWPINQWRKSINEPAYTRMRILRKDRLLEYQWKMCSWSYSTQYMPAGVDILLHWWRYATVLGPRRHLFCWHTIVILECYHTQESRNWEYW